MTTHRALQLAASVAWAACLAVGPAAALDLCVSCAGPEAHYNCRLDMPAANPRDLRLQLLCISQIATTGGHETCAVDSPQPVTCAGALKVVAAPDEILEQPAAPEPKAAAKAPAQPAPAATVEGQPAAQDETVIPKPAKPPKTVQEMVEKGAAATGQSVQAAGGAVKGAATSAGSVLQKAGAAVSNAAKKSWECLSTLFGNC